MPHMFINRPRLHNLTKGHEDLQAQFRWEMINAFLYKIGAGLFIIYRGSGAIYARLGALPLGHRGPTRPDHFIYFSGLAIFGRQCPVSRRWRD